MLDGAEARLTLLEADQRDLRHDNLLLKSENEALKQRLAVLENMGLPANNVSRSPFPLKAFEDFTQLVNVQTRSMDNLTQVVDDQKKEIKNLTKFVDTLRTDQQQHTALLTLLKHQADHLEATTQHQHTSLASLTGEVHLLEATHLRDNAALKAHLSNLDFQVNRTKAGQTFSHFDLTLRHPTTLPIKGTLINCFLFTAACPIGISPKTNSCYFSRGKLAATESYYQSYGACRLF